MKLTHSTNAYQIETMPTKRPFSPLTYLASATLFDRVRRFFSIYKHLLYYNTIRIT